MFPPSDPVKHRHRAPPILVGRSREQARLRAFLDDALAGAGSMVLVSGEAGIGKSTLVAELVREALDRGALVLAGGCYDLTATPVFGPWIEVTQSYPDDPALPPLPDQLGAGGEVAGTDNQAALFDLVVRFLVRVSSTRPLVLVFEDLHWADPASLDLLRVVARAMQDRPALLIGTYRDDEPATNPDFFGILPALVRDTQCFRLTLQRLDRSAVLDLVRAHYTLSPPDEGRLVDYLAGLAEGNPFFTTELLYMLAEQRLLAPAGDLWELGDLVETGVPPLIQQVVSARVSMLDDVARTVLDAIVVIGIEAPLDLLQRVFDGTPAELDDAVQQALDRHLILLTHNQQEIRLSHALVWQSIYEAIAPMRRRRLHRQIADLLAQDWGPDPEVVAGHLLNAGDARGMDWLIRAAERAYELFAVETVIARCHQAYELATTTGTGVPVAVYRLHGLALEMVGDFTGARETLELALETARRLNDPRAAWRACFDLGNLWASRDYERSRMYLEQVLDLAREIGAPDLLGRSFNRLGNWHVNADHLDHGIQLHREALDIFERTGDQPGVVATLELLGMAYHMAGDIDRAAAYYRRVIPLLSAIDDRRALVTATVVSATTVPSVIPLNYILPTFQPPSASDAYRFDTVDTAIGIAQDIGWRAGEAFGLALGAHTAQLLGNYRRALDHGWQAMTIASEIDHHLWLATSLTSLGTTYLDLLAFDRAAEHLERANRVGLGASSRFLSEYAAVQLASTYIARHELDRVERLIRPRFDIARLEASLRQRDYCFVLAQLELARRDPGAALTLLDHLEVAMPGTHGEKNPHLHKLRGEALIAQRHYQEAEPILRDALRYAQASGFRPLLWRIQVSLRKLYLEQGRTQDAESMRQVALKGVADLAAGVEDDGLRQHFLAQAHALLPEGLPFQPDGLAVLTAREREVLTLVARGMTDAQAAGELFISPRTVSQHLRSIYTKLDVTNRAAAVRVAMEQHLLEPSPRPPN